MFRFKLLAAVLSVFVAVFKEHELLKPEQASPEVGQNEPDLPHNESKPILLNNIALSEKLALAGNVDVQAEKKKEEKTVSQALTVTASIYYPVPEQTDSSPFITADGSEINKHNPGKHRWLAVSRDLHQRWGGNISYGDSLWVSGISEKLDGLYIVRDVMNQRIRKRIDILVGKDDDVMGFWENVQIARL